MTKSTFATIVEAAAPVIFKIKTSLQEGEPSLKRPPVVSGSVNYSSSISAGTLFAPYNSSMFPD